MTFLLPSAAEAHLQINELMQSNINSLLDDLNEFPDSWVEIYNPDSVAVSLESCSIGIANDFGTSYSLPHENVLEPGQFIVMYCDKTDHGLHANFRIDSGKGILYLFQKGVVVDSVTFKKMPAPGIAYGRKTECSEKWGYQQSPTPGSANCGQLLKDVLPDPLFGRSGGLCTEAFDLALTIPEGAPQGTVIRYTLDGSMPSDTSPIYSDTLHIASSTSVRARLDADGWLAAMPVTQSYIFHPREVTLPVVSIAGNPEYFYSDSLGILSKSVWTDSLPNFAHDWRRPVNVEYFALSDSAAAINQLCETRVKGGFTRYKNWLNSLALYANKRFGTKRFQYELFPSQKPGVRDFKSIELRNAGNDCDLLFFRDAMIQHIFGKNTDIDWSASQPAVIYINGHYKGLLNIRERQNEDNVYSNHAGLEDIDFVDCWGFSEGEEEHFEDFKSFYLEPGHTFEEWRERIEIQPFLNNMIAAIFFDNTDFPANNYNFWRPTAEGGKWRWLMKDFDTALGCSEGEWPEFPYLFWLKDETYLPEYHSVGNAWWATAQFNNFTATQQGREMFIDMFSVYMGDFLRPDCFDSVCDSMASNIAVELTASRQYYGIDGWDWSRHDVQIPYVKDFEHRRVEFMYRHLADFFGLGTPVPLRIDEGDAREETKYSINGIELKKPDFDGRWHAGRALTVSAAGPEPPAAWQVTIAYPGHVSHWLSQGPVLSDFTMPDAQSVTLTPLWSLDGTEDVSLGRPVSTPQETARYSPAGRRVGQDYRGLVIVKYADGTAAKELVL